MRRPPPSACNAGSPERIAGATARAVEHTGTVSRDVAAVAGKADETAALARFVTDQARETARIVDRLGEDTVTGLRRSENGDRRRFPRTPCEVDATLDFGSGALAGRTRDLSKGGALVALDRGAAPGSGTLGIVELAAIGTFAAEIRDVSTLGVHLAFGEADAATADALDAALARVAHEDEAFAARVQAGARAIEARFEDALTSGRVDPDDLFDTDYRPVAGSDPQQFTTRFTALCDELLPDIQEPLKSASPRVAFAAAMDRNAYLPTHNHVFARAQRPGDPAWNAANCRHRRKFDDRAGLAAARNTKPVLLQSYQRDMGGGHLRMLKEVDAPVMVRGRHWGCLRLAYALR